MPADYEESNPNWRYAKVDDLPRAARDWPQLTFIIYHAAIRPGSMVDAAHLEEVERTGRVPWVTDLAEIPAKYGVKNVAADLGTVFAASCVQHPRHAALILGTLIKGLGAQNVYWGTDSIWHGSPQWQIEAFRRIEIPEDMRAKHGFAPLGDARSPVKEQILGLNAARLYALDPAKAQAAAQADAFAGLARDYAAAGRSPEAAHELLAGIALRA